MYLQGVYLSWCFSGSGGDVCVAESVSVTMCNSQSVCVYLSLAVCVCILLCVCVFLGASVILSV